MRASIERLRRRNEKSGDGGFTLIELLIIIAILGILAAIVVFAIQNLYGQSTQAACQAEYKTVESALEAYKAQVGKYPSSINAMTSTYTTGIGTTGSVGPWLKDTAPTAASDNPKYWFSVITATGPTNGEIVVNATTGAAAGATSSTGSNSACSQA